MKLAGLQVAVIGGGIGGVVAALSLARRGAQVELHEQAAALEEVGAGLQISANGQQVLRGLGVVDAASPDAAVVAQGTVLRDGARGRVVARIGAPAAGQTWYLHRADLLALLVSSARGAGVDIRLGRPILPGDISTDLVIAADGARSVWRAHVDGPDAPRFTGQVAWRALVPVARGPVAQLFMGRGAHVVAYPLRDGQLTNLVAVEERKDWRDEGWQQPGNPAELRARFAQFGGDAGALIAMAEQVHIWALHARPVATRWHRQNVALLGDAAHPTLPFMAQGACLALEDAWVLAATLANADTLESGLRAYEVARKARAQQVVALAAGNAWRFHLGKPWAWGAQAVLAAGAPILARRLDRVYGYDATALFPG